MLQNAVWSQLQNMLKGDPFNGLECKCVPATVGLTNKSKYANIGINIRKDLWDILKCLQQKHCQKQCGNIGDLTHTIAFHPNEQDHECSKCQSFSERGQHRVSINVT